VGHLLPVTTAFAWGDGIHGGWGCSPACVLNMERCHKLLLQQLNTTANTMLLSPCPLPASPYPPPSARTHAMRVCVSLNGPTPCRLKHHMKRVYHC
jgi:hypothetical protein